MNEGEGRGNREGIEMHEHEHQWWGDLERRKGVILGNGVSRDGYGNGEAPKVQV